MDGQLLGIALQAGSSSCAELKEITPGSPAALTGMTAKIRSFNDSSVLVPWCITEINGRPLNMFAKEGEAMERLQALGRYNYNLMFHDVKKTPKEYIFNCFRLFVDITIGFLPSFLNLFNNGM